ncbi:NACHT domain-containing protein [Hoeflea sp.]|uniref:NACHT domain-containing protein n=1 Tax=Hoeflea sp. TaxID=1940281 RepID=UPI0037497BEB
MAAEFLAPVIAAGTKVITERLLNKVFLKEKKNLNKKEDIGKALKEHFESTYNKCLYTKTVLSDKKENFADIYSGQAFFIDGMRIDQNKLTEIITKGSTVVIQGTGGGGKSMYVRYLWLYTYAELQSSIPIFIELRNLNNANLADIKDYIFHTAVSDSTKFSQVDFSEALQRGQIMLFLDGFDEVNINQIEKVQKGIIDLKERYPKIVIVVTSRDHDRFSGWHQFDMVKVASLNVQECVKLISKAPFDEVEKSRFIQKVKSDLYKNYTSFLSNPLLIYMTLVTYGYNPNFSKQMHEFYAQAFEALYYRHDLTKGGAYVREYRTELPKNLFERMLSYFCIRTYFDQAVDFSEFELNEYISKSKEIELDVFGDMDVENFKLDILHNVCILKKDGLQYTFTHRKFQEYFAAYCLARVASRDMERMLNHISSRYSDEVLSMVYDLNKELFREKYILPNSKKYKNFFNLRRNSSIFENYAKMCGYSFTFTNGSVLRVVENKKNKIKSKNIIDMERVPIRLDASEEFEKFTKNIENLYDMHYPECKFSTRTSSHDRDDEFVFDLVKKIGKFKKIKILYGSWRPTVMYTNSEIEEWHEFDNIDLKLWNRTGIKSFIEAKAISLHGFVNMEMKRYNNIAEKFDELF